MRLKMTQDYIDRGAPEDGERCPWALCIKEAIGEKDVAVNDYSVEIWANGLLREIVLPQKVVAWINRFDEDGPDAVRPMTVDLPLEEILDEILEPV